MLHVVLQWVLWQSDWPTTLPATGQLQTFSSSCWIWTKSRTPSSCWLWVWLCVSVYVCMSTKTHTYERQRQDIYVQSITDVSYMSKASNCVYFHLDLVEAHRGWNKTLPGNIRRKYVWLTFLQMDTHTLPAALLHFTHVFITLHFVFV